MVIPWDYLKTGNKWSKYEASVELLRTVCPTKTDEKTWRKMVREANKKPTATLK